MDVNVHLVSWITDYLTERPQFVRLKDCVSETVLCSSGAPQGTVLSPVLFTLYTSDFTYNSESCHIQKFSDDSAIVGCIRDGQEGEYRSQVDNFVQWCRHNDLHRPGFTRVLRPVSHPHFGQRAPSDKIC